jgi:hypothetical protein
MNIKSLLLPCLFSALTTTLVAAPPQYSARKDIATGFTYLNSLAVADFNGDGKPDFAVADQGSPTLLVYLNKGDGTFADPVKTVLSINGAAGGALIAGDFDQDGKQDLVICIRPHDSGTYDLSPIVLGGNGDGTFTFRSRIAGTGQVTSGIVANIPGDSYLDLILSGNSLGTLIATGYGGGQFTRSPISGTNFNTKALVTTDLNGDSNPEIVASVLNSPTIQVFSGRTYFSLLNTFVTPGITNTQTMSAADFNGDGKLDLLLGSTGRASIIFGNGDATFQTTTYRSLALPQATTTATAFTATADVNNDQKPDVIVADAGSNTLNIFLNDGAGTFPQTAPDFTVDMPQYVSQMQVADFNGDGIPDIILTNYQTQNVSVFLSIRPKTTPTATLTSSANSQFVGTSLSFTAKITGTTGTMPTGTVTLLDGTTSLGQQTLDSTGQAVFSLANLTAGQHSLTASYSGDTNFNTATSSALAQSITDFQVTLPTSSQTVTAGGTATYSLTVTPAGGLTGSISLTCSQLPSLATCDPVTIPITGQPATATLTVHTTAPVTRSASTIHAAALGLLSIALTVLLPLRRRRNLQLLTVLTACTLIGLATGCSSGSSGSKTPTVVSPGTPQGATPFTITSSITLGGQTLTRTTTATLVVQ